MSKSKLSPCETFYRARMMATNWSPNNLCDPPTPTDLAFETLIDELLGKDWYVTMPENHEQTNTAAVAAILRKYRDPIDYRIVFLVIVSLIGIFGIGLWTGMMLL